MIDSECDSCGSMLPHPDGEGNVTCLSCGRASRVAPEAPPEPERSPTTIIVAPLASDSAKAAGSGMKVGCVVVGLLLAACGVVAAVLGLVAVSEVGDELGGSSGSGSDLLVLGGTATLVPGSESDPQVLVTVQDISASRTERTLALVRIGDDESELVWQSEPISPSGSLAQVAVGADTLYVGIDDEARALDPATGETQWIATLTDKVTPGCESCFAVVEDRLVVRTADAQVTGYGAASNEQQWSRRLRSASGSISVVSGRLLLVDDPEDAAATAEAELVDPKTGAVVARSTPTCPRDPSTPWDLELSPRDRIYSVEGSDDVIAGFGFGDGCIARWNPSSGEIRWATRVPGASSMQQDQVIAGSRHFVVATTAGSLLAADVNSGALVALAPPTDTSAAPLVLEGDVLVAERRSTRGSAKAGLVAWDLASGELQWDTALPDGAEFVSTNEFFASDALFAGTPRAMIAPTAEGLNLLVFDGGDRSVTTRSVAVATGELGEGATRSFASRSRSGTPSLSVVGLAADRVVVTLDSLVQAIPIQPGGPIVTFPTTS